jgi:hypothetical protein
MKAMPKTKCIIFQCFIKIKMKGSVRFRYSAYPVLIQ